MAALVGAELLAKIASLEGVTKIEMAEACGYFSEKDGKRSYHHTELYEAMLEAKGLSLPIVRGKGGSSDGPRGKALSYRTSQQAKNSIVVGAGYVTQLGYEPGQQFEIAVDAEQGIITLAAVADEEEEPVAA